MQQAAPQDLAETLLERLEDIHPAVAPSWWPPAPGWWLLAAVGLAAVVYFGWRAYRRLQVSRRRRDLIKLLDGIAAEYDPVGQAPAYLSAVNSLMRAVALRAFPATGCARLEGEDWVRFIQARLPLESSDREDPLEALAEGPFQRRVAFEVAPLNERVRQWVLTYG